MEQHGERVNYAEREDIKEAEEEDARMLSGGWGAMFKLRLMGFNHLNLIPGHATIMGIYHTRIRTTGRLF